MWAPVSRALVQGVMQNEVVQRSSAFHRLGSWTAEKLNNLPNVVHLVSGRPGIRRNLHWNMGLKQACIYPLYHRTMHGELPPLRAEQTKCAGGCLTATQFVLDTKLWA